MPHKDFNVYQTEMPPDSVSAAALLTGASFNSIALYSFILLVGFRVVLTCFFPGFFVEKHFVTSRF